MRLNHDRTFDAMDAERVEATSRRRRRDSGRGSAVPVARGSKP
jgi:hypothetical protein